MVFLAAAFVAAPMPPNAAGAGAGATGAPPSKAGSIINGASRVGVAVLCACAGIETSIPPRPRPIEASSTTNGKRAGSGAPSERGSETIRECGTKMRDSNQ